MTKKVIFLITTALALLAFTGLTLAQSAAVSLTPDRNELTVGDPLQMTLTVQHNPAEQVIIPELGQTWGNFEVRSQSTVQTRQNDDGTAVTQQLIEATLFAPGTYQTPPLEITLRQGDQSQPITVPPIEVNVLSVLPAGETTLADIKPQASLPVPFPWIMLVLGGGLTLAVLALAGWALWRYLRRRPVQVDNRTPEHVVLDELARINTMKLIDKGRYKQHYTLVADALRTYLAVEFHLNTFERTTRELNIDLQKSAFNENTRRQIITFFTESDMVKFAKFTPDYDVAQQSIDWVRRIVALTRPVEVHTEHPASAQTPNPQSPTPLSGPEVA